MPSAARGPHLGPDYEAVFRLLDGLPAPVPLIIQDAAEDDVARVRAFLLGHARAQGWAA